MSTVRDVNQALNVITGGRVPQDIAGLFSGASPFVVVKSSSIPGKEVMEIPGLVYGKYDQPIRKLGVLMTLNESHIELAGAMGVDALVAHHPIADAANSGGVTLKSYLDLYNIAVFELHEAFHGLHPGIAYLHGHQSIRVDIAYGGIPGNIMFVGRSLPEVKSLGDMVKRVTGFMGGAEDDQLLAQERALRNCQDIQETANSARSYILVGKDDSPVQNVLHIFPHTGFTVGHLENALREHPEIDTLLATISRVRPDHALAEKCRELGLNFVVGNSHALEIFENGLPLAAALDKLLPDVEVLMFRERITATPISQFGTTSIREYAEMISEKYLVNKPGN